MTTKNYLTVNQLCENHRALKPGGIRAEIRAVIDNLEININRYLYENP